jgi:MtrB/PioB family decaheme-associated outer membrane protein
MKTQNRFGFSLTATAAGLLAAFGTAYAAEGDEIAELTKPASSVQGGIGYVDKDNGRFGQYNGLNEKGGYGLLDLDFVKRDDATGRWLIFRGSNLGLDHRDLRFEHEIQGNWGYYIDFSQTPRFEPYTVNTAVTGIGTNNLTIPTTPTAGPALRLKTERDALGLGFHKNLPGNWDFKVTFRNEEKDGARVFARGTTGGPGNFEFAPEPINSTTRQIEATLNYTGERLQLSGGYYGTMFNNEYNGLNFTGGVGALSTFTPIGLPPDNHSHQLYVSGGYNFTQTTRGSFKLAYARAEQDDIFVSGVNVPLAPGIGNNLQGRVDTTLAQFGLVSRPMPKLTVRASLRYDDRDDRTPVLRYNTLAVGGSTHNGENEPRSIRTTSGKLEASYALPMSFRVTGGVDYDEKKRSVSPVRIVSHRDKTEETAYRVELRRSMSETITGAVALIHSERDGTPFLPTTLNPPPPNVLGSNVIAPIHLADRKRDTVRLTANWQPTDPLSLQFRVDQSKDDYDGDRDGSGLGPREGEARNYTVDASVNFSERWQGSAWYSHNDTKLDQASRTSGGQLWAAALRSLGKSFGLGLRGKPYGRLEVGADLSQSDIDDEYRQQAITGAPITSLPDVNTRLTRVSLFAKYALQKNSGIRVDYVYDRFKTDDWTWTTWTYTDGTTLTQAPVQKVNFIGVSYYYRWQ